MALRRKGNDLEDGESRLGFLYDSDERTPDMSYLLENHDGRILLTVPWTRRYGGEYSRWFRGKSTSYGDDPNRSLFAYSVPANLSFRDGLGPVALVRCRGVGYLEQMFGGGSGRGHIRIDFAVVGGREAADWSTIHGLRSEIAGLGSWMGLNSTTQRLQLENNRVQHAELHVESLRPWRSPDD